MLDLSTPNLVAADAHLYCVPKRPRTRMNFFSHHPVCRASTQCHRLFGIVSVTEDSAGLLCQTVSELRLDLAGGLVLGSPAALRDVVNGQRCITVA